MCALRQRADKGEKRFLQKQSLTTSKKSLELRGDGPKEAARPLPAACGHSQARAVPVVLGLEPQGPAAGEPDLDSQLELAVRPGPRAHWGAPVAAPSSGLPAEIHQGPRLTVRSCQAGCGCGSALKWANGPRPAPWTGGGSWLFRPRQQLGRGGIRSQLWLLFAPANPPLWGSLFSSTQWG